MTAHTAPTFDPVAQRCADLANAAASGIGYNGPLYKPQEFSGASAGPSMAAFYSFVGSVAHVARKEVERARQQHRHVNTMLEALTLKTETELIEDAFAASLLAAREGEPSAVKAARFREELAKRNLSINFAPIPT